MKLSPPYPLPPTFPAHAPLPPGGPWIRPPANPRLAVPPGRFPPRPGEPRPQAPRVDGYPLGVGIPPSLTPLAMAGDRQIPKVYKLSA